MSRFWNWVSNLTPGETARAAEVDKNLSEISNALTLVESEMNRCLRVGAAANPGLDLDDLEVGDSAAQRAGKVLGADGAGKPIWTNAAFKFRGVWAATTIYSVNDIVQVGVEKSLYLCTVGHTASAAFSTDQATKWVQLLDLTELRKAIRTFQVITTAQSPFQASAGDDLMVDVTSGAVTIVLPASPDIVHQPVSVVHVAGPVEANNIVVSRNGQNIMGLAENMAVSDPNAAFELAFCNATLGWRLVRGT